MNPKRIVIASNTSWYIVNYRSNLIRALMRTGYDVTAVAPSDEYSASFLEIGCQYRPIAMDNKGTNPVKDFRLLLDFYSCFREVRPDCFLGFTIKPNIYGSIAAQMLHIPCINNIAGLGSAFVRRNWLTTVASWLYRIALRRSRLVFFQNEDDRRAFVSARVIAADRSVRLPGSGVDVTRFAPADAETSGSGRKFRFLLLGRLLWDKGVKEYVEAARCILRQRTDMEFRILGFAEVANPSAVSRAELCSWDSEGLIRYLGHTLDVRPHIAEADCVVLPSYYREGVPRSLLEAASMGKPVITTDMPGCRDAVEDGVTGFLVAARDVGGLVERMERMAGLAPEQRRTMGLCGREKMLREFDERIVLNRYVEVVGALFVNDV